MPEGHSIHRIARQFERNFIGKVLSASSPQGRFTAGAEQISGKTLIAAQAVGKQLFLEFNDGRWLRVHLGIYGAWDFAGKILIDPTILAANGRMGQTNQKGAELDGLEDSVASIGAPRLSRLRIAETEKQLLDSADDAGSSEETTQFNKVDFPPAPVGQVRLRLLSDETVADLRGPTVCELIEVEQVNQVLKRLGPDPLSFDGDSPEAEQRVVDRISSSNTNIALLLMDQSVIAGIGNVYRAEMLFRAELNPFLPGKSLPERKIRELWQDWKFLLAEGVRTGQMITRDSLSESEFSLAMSDREHRHWVYKREGKPCRVCGTSIVLQELGGRKLYFCPKCQI